MKLLEAETEQTYSIIHLKNFIFKSDNVLLLKYVYVFFDS